MKLAFGIVLLVMAVFLIVAVLMQSGKDKKLSVLTTVVAIVFVLVVVAMYIFVG